MAIQSLLDGTSLRSLQILGGADALVADPTGTALHAADSVVPRSLLGSLPLTGLGSGTALPDGASAVTPIVGAAEAALTGAAATGGLNTGLLGPLQAVPGALSAQGLETLANTAVLDLHATLEGAADASGTSGTVHGLTGLGETIGLGKIGGGNVLTDVLDTPTAVLAGNVAPIANLPTHLSSTVSAAQHLVSGVAGDVASGAFLADPVGNLGAAVSHLTALPVTALANDAIDTLHATLEGALDPVLPGTIHGITGLGNAIGLGEIGSSNLLTDVTSLPTSVLSGDLSPVTHLPADLGQIAGAVGSALGGVGHDLGGSLLGGLTHPTTGGGILGGVLPDNGAVAGVLGQVESALGGAGGATGLGGLTQAVTHTVDTLASGPHSLGGDLLQVPGAILQGVSHGLAPLPGDGGATLGALGGVIGAAAHEVTSLGGSSGGILAPMEGALHGGIGHIVDGHVVEGLAHAATGLLGGLQGGSGSHDLVTIAVGPQTPTSGLGLDVLSTGSGPMHVVDTHVGSVGAPVPTVATLGLLSGDSLHLPTCGCGGGDALSGVLAPVTGGASAPSAGAGAHATIDLAVVHIDVPIAAAHADPLSALAHAVHHA